MQPPANTKTAERTPFATVPNGLRDSEAILRTVTNEARVGLVIVDQCRQYLFANQTYADILGLPDANLVGKRVSDVLGPAYERVRPRLDRAFLGGRGVYETRIAPHPKTKDERIYEVVYEPRGIGGVDPYVLVVIVDITERKRVQQDLEALVAERTARLQETVQDLEAFSYSIAHDMRAPLRAMHGFAMLFLEQFGDCAPEEGKEYLRRITSAAVRLDQLIQDVLCYSRVVRQELPLQRMDLEQLAREIVASYPQLSAPHVTIRIEGPMPAVLASPAAMTQILSNLLGNAVKFVKPGEHPRIRVCAERVGATTGAGAAVVRLWVEDRGIGIPKELQSGLFSMFQRLNTTHEGSGVGLAIVRKATERMGGRVGVESEAGKGSRFWVELREADDGSSA